MTPSAGPAPAAPAGRIGRLDALRGIAMLLVVAGHVIQRNTPAADPWHFWLIAQRIIASIDMPLFAAVAGFVTFGRVHTPEWKWLLGKARRLLVPFFVWSVLFQLFGDLRYPVSLPAYLLQVVQHPEMGLWFLWVLFLCYVLVAAVHRPLRRIGPVWSLLVIALAVQFLPFDAFGAWQVRWFFPWFVLGYAVAAHRDRLRAPLRQLAPAALVVYALALYVSLPTPGSVWEVTSQTLHDALSPAGALLILNKVVLTAAGIVLVDTLVRAWTGTWVDRLLQRFGTVSLGIYGAHLFFLHLPLGTGMTRIVLVTAVAAAASLALCMLFERSRILSALFLGGGYRGPWRRREREAEAGS